MHNSIVRTLSLAVIAAGFGFAALLHAASPVTLAQANPPGAAAPAGGAGAPGRAGGGRGGLGRAPVTPPGPPMPVPAEVAIPRPSTAEVTQFNDALSRLIDADRSPSKSVLDKYKSLATIEVQRDNPCVRPTPGIRAGRHNAFVDIAKAGNIDLLLQGDSITDWWVQAPAENTKFFGKYKTANFGVAGDTTQGILWGLQNGEGEGFYPKAIMLMIGTNSMGNASPAEIAEGIGAIIQDDKKRFPNAKILLLGIFPRGTPTDINRIRIAECNKIIAKLEDKKTVFFMDIGDKFLDPQTKAFLPNTFRNDMLHPVAGGYEIWGNAVAATLEDWLK